MCAFACIHVCMCVCIVYGVCSIHTLQCMVCLKQAKFDEAIRNVQYRRQKVIFICGKEVLYSHPIFEL